MPNPFQAASFSPVALWYPPCFVPRQLHQAALPPRKTPLEEKGTMTQEALVCLLHIWSIFVHKQRRKSKRQEIGWTSLLTWPILESCLFLFSPSRSCLAPASRCRLIFFCPYFSSTYHKQHIFPSLCYHFSVIQMCDNERHLSIKKIDILRLLSSTGSQALSIKLGMNVSGLTRLWRVTFRADRVLTEGPIGILHSALPPH